MWRELSAGEWLILITGSILIILLMLPLFIFNEVSLEYMSSLARDAYALVRLWAALGAVVWLPLICLWIWERWTMPRIREVMKLLRTERGA